MNANDVIREELALAQERIIARLTAMFMGGEEPPAPRAHTPAPVRTAHSDFSSTHEPITIRPTGRAAMGTNRAQKDRAREQAERDIEKVLTYVAENPGCYGKDLMRVIGCENGGDRRYINVTKRIRLGQMLITRGNGRMQTYFLNPKMPIGAASPPVKAASAKSPGKGRGKNIAAKIDDPDARDDILVAYVKKYPDTTPPDLRDHFADGPGMGKAGAVMSAIHRLTIKGRLKKRPTNKTGRGGQPMMALRAIK